MNIDIVRGYRHDGFVKVYMFVVDKRLPTAVGLVALIVRFGVDQILPVLFKVGW